MLLLGSHLICTLIFNFVLLCVFYFFFFSLSLSLLFDKIFYSCTRTHTCICAHKCARARSLPAADALRSLTHTGPAESRVARARYDVSLAHTHAFVHTHIQRQSSSFCCHIFCTFLFRFSTLPFYHFFSNVHSFFFCLLCAAQPLPPSCAAAFASGIAAAAAAVAINEPANQNKKCFSVAKCR